MLEVEKWAEDKPFLLALFAPVVAHNAQILHEAFGKIKDRKFLDHQLPLPGKEDLSSWFKLYRSHNTSVEVLKSIYAIAVGEKLSHYGYICYQFLTSHRTWIKLCLHKQTVTPRHYEFAYKVRQYVLSKALKMLKADLSRKPMNPVKKAAIINYALNNFEVSFFILVTAPCWLLYKTTPTYLYWQSKHGNPDAIEKLLRLDSLMINDPVIRDHIVDLQLEKNKNELFVLLQTAPTKMPVIKITPKHIQADIAGLISALSHVIGYPLGPKEIQSLNVALAQDSLSYLPDESCDADDDPSDDEQQKTDWAFAKSVDRSRGAWLKMFGSDKTIFPNVRKAAPPP